MRLGWLMLVLARRATATQMVTCTYQLMAEDYFDPQLDDVMYGLCKQINAMSPPSYFVLVEGIEQLRPGDVVTITIEEQHSGSSSRIAQMPQASVLADGQPAYKVVEVHKVVPAVPRPMRSALDERSLLTIRLVYTNGESPCDEACVQASMWAAEDSVEAITWESSYNVTTFPEAMGDIISVSMGASVPGSCDYAGQADAADNLARIAGYEPGNYVHVKYFLPDTSACSWGGCVCPPPPLRSFCLRVILAACGGRISVCPSSMPLFPPISICYTMPCGYLFSLQPHMPSHTSPLSSALHSAVWATSVAPLHSHTATAARGSRPRIPLFVRTSLAITTDFHMPELPHLSMATAVR
mgnify:CR=1 FL=1